MPEATDPNQTNDGPIDPQEVGNTGTGDPERCEKCGEIMDENHKCEISDDRSTPRENDIPDMDAEIPAESSVPDASPSPSAPSAQTGEQTSVKPEKPEDVKQAHGNKQQNVSPEAEAVAVNKPATAPDAKTAAKAAVPKKIGREKKSAKSQTRFLLGFAGGFVILFISFIILMVLMISRSGSSNSVMNAFGLDPGGIRNFLQGVVGLSFGFLSLIFLVILVIALFKFIGAQKSDKDKRRRNGKMMAGSGISLIFVVFIWVILATYIGRIEIAADRVIAEIVILEPDDLSELEAPVEIRFSALNVATALQQSGIEILVMNWDLDGDGLYETPVSGNPEVTHLYNQRGTITIGLEVKVIGGDKEYTEIYTKNISIETAVFEADPPRGTAPLAVQFDASNIVKKDNMKSLDWDFDGDGVFEIEGPDNLKPRYTFEKIGTYTVQLRAIDKNNNVQNFMRDIEIVTSDTPILSAQIDSSPGLTGVIPMQIRFDAKRSVSLKGTITKYQWDFGDGSNLQSGQTVSHVFNDAGFYTVSLAVEDSLGNEATTSVEVDAQGISSVPEAVISTAPAGTEDGTLTGTLPFKVTFDASNSLDADDDIIKYMWDFNGDGKIDSEGAEAKWTFEKAGNFPVSLTVIDTENQTSDAVLSVVVAEPGVQTQITATPEEGTAPLTVQFDGSSSTTYEGNIVSYEWDFGDGSPKTITGAIVSHKYSTVGTYDVKLTVLTNANDSASGNKLIYVREIPLKACFTPSRTTGLAPLTVSFDSKCSTGTISSYSWQFGDGIESTSASPTHTFDFAGAYNVTFEVTDDKNNVNSYQEVIVAEGNVTSK